MCVDVSVCLCLFVRMCVCVFLCVYICVYVISFPKNHSFLLQVSVLFSKNPCFRLLLNRCIRFTHFQDCDAFTRNYLTKAGTKVPGAEELEPADPYFVHRKQEASTMQPHRPYEKCDTLKQVRRCALLRFV